MFTQTKKVVLVEYHIDVVYDTLMFIFPFKYYKLKQYDYSTHDFTIIDSFNPEFIMHIILIENSNDTTTISFLADYPQALFDLTHGGQQAIDMILEELLKQLEKKSKTTRLRKETSDIEVVDGDSFVNSTKNKTHTLTIIVGYILSVSGLLLPMSALIKYNPNGFSEVILFIMGILCLSFEISLSVILQYYEDSKSIMHGRIQLCLCGITLIILGIMIHPSLIIAGILIPLVAIIYFLKRQNTIK